MMEALVDTQLLVWLAEKPEKLPKSASTVLREDFSRMCFSQVSIWEVAIKSALGRRDFVVNPQHLVKGLLDFGFAQLDIANDHIFEAVRLPDLHGDPFDRLLVAQAKVEGLTLMTTDKTLAKYGSFVKRY